MSLDLGELEQRRIGDGIEAVAAVAAANTLAVGCGHRNEAVTAAKHEVLVVAVEDGRSRGSSCGVGDSCDGVGKQHQQRRCRQCSRNRGSSSGEARQKSTRTRQQ